MRRPYALVMLSSLLACTAMAAEPGVGIYVHGMGGYTFPDGDVELDELVGENSGPLPNADLSLDDGGLLAVAVGYDFGEIRVEGEVAYRYNDWDRATSGGFATSGVDGDFQALSVMANGIFEVPAGDVVSFYAGGGAGVAAIHLDGRYGASDIDIQTGALAYQVMAGVAFRLSDHVTLNVGYRFWSCLDTDFDDDRDDDDDREDLEGDLSVPVFHTVEIGLRYTF